MKLKSVSTPLVNTLQREQIEKNHNLHAGVSSNVFKPLLHKSIITRKPPLAQSYDQNLKNKYLNKKPLSTSYLAPSIFNLNLDLNKTEQEEEKFPPISDSYIPPPKSAGIVQDKIKIVSVSDSYLPPPRTSNIDLSVLNPTKTTTQSTFKTGNSKKTKETFKHTIPYSYIAPIQSTPAPIRSNFDVSTSTSDKDKIKPSFLLTQYSLPSASYVPKDQIEDPTQVKLDFFNNMFDFNLSGQSLIS